jgi:hypothetical protein
MTNDCEGEIAILSIEYHKATFHSFPLQSTAIEQAGHRVQPFNFCSLYAFHSVILNSFKVLHKLLFLFCPVQEQAAVVFNAFTLDSGLSW